MRINPIIVVMAIGVALIVFMYLAYVYVIPPFYTLNSYEIKRAGRRLEVGGANLTTHEPGLLIFPNITLGVVRDQLVVRKADFNISLKLSIKIAYGSPGKEVNVTVYCDHEILLQKTVNESVSISDIRLTKQFPLGLWKLGLENPQLNGYTVWLQLENPNPENVKVDVKYEGEAYYREGSLMNFLIVLIGFILVGGSILQSLYTIHRKRVEERLRKIAKE